MPLDSKRRGRIVAGLAGLGISIGYLLAAIRLPVGTMAEPGGGVFPLIVGAAFAVVSFGTIVEATRGDGEGGSIALPEGIDRRRLLLLVVIMFGYAVLLPFLGQLVASFCFIAAALRILSRLSLLRVAIYAAIVAAVSFWLFVMVLRVPMPIGILGLLWM